MKMYASTEEILVQAQKITNLLLGDKNSTAS